MKKFSLLLCCFVALLVSQRALAQAVLSEDDKTLTITTTASGQVSAKISAMDLALSADQKAAITKIILNGKFNSADLGVISNTSGFTGVVEVDMKEARIVSTESSGNTLT